MGTGERTLENFPILWTPWLSYFFFTNFILITARTTVHEDTKDSAKRNDGCYKQERQT